MKKCNIEWWGLLLGPKFVQVGLNHNGKIDSDNAIDPELNDLLNKAFEYQRNDQTFLYSNKVVDFLKKNGWEVEYNAYASKVNEAMTSAEADEFIERLKDGEVKFKFEKVDGTVREARGTLKQELLPVRGDVDSTRRRRAIPDSVIVFFDLDKQMFRSFRKDNFIEYID